MLANHIGRWSSYKPAMEPAGSTWAYYIVFAGICVIASEHRRIIVLT